MEALCVAVITLLFTLVTTAFLYQFKRIRHLETMQDWNTRKILEGMELDEVRRVKDDEDQE